jgi:hypothetical protein
MGKKTEIDSLGPIYIFKLSLMEFAQSLNLELDLYNDPNGGIIDREIIEYRICIK